MNRTGLQIYFSVRLDYRLALCMDCKSYIPALSYIFLRGMLYQLGSQGAVKLLMNT
uniref:Uncharacterized protein n=1 Tax=Arundo donax TaxID=35708 RepID=A0A0A9EUE3_ARUDO